MVCALLGSLVLVGVHPRVEAKIWRVERDGGGDFATIQLAIDAAAEGDTIVIGAGRYAEMAPDSFGEPTVGYVETDNLTFIGTDRDRVIVGPEEADFENFGPNGIGQATSVRTATYTNMTFENVFDGLELVGNVAVVECVFRHCSLGINAAANLTVEQCVFRSNDIGIYVGESGDFGRLGSSLRNSLFEDNAGDGVISSYHNTLVENCEFRGGDVGFHQVFGKTGTIVSCRFFGNGTAVWGSNTGEVALYDTTIAGVSGRAILMTSESHLRGSGNRIGPAGLYTLDLWSRSTADFHGNDILFSDEGVAVRLLFYEITVDVDLRDNFWGTTDVDLIERKILDKEDQLGVVTNVILEPIRAYSVPLRGQSVGSIKSLFSGSKEHQP